MKKDLPFVSVIIPCRNEEKYIGQCLDSIIEQDFEKENLEVLVVNGASQDNTRGVVNKYANQHPFIKLLENREKYTPFGLNIGIREAKGEIIVRMDAHARYEKDYISKCVKYMKEYNADNVGGVIKTLPTQNTFVAKAIAICLSSLFGAASFFRLGSRKIREVDTVFGGCYRKEIFQKIGLYNENLIRSQDIELNLRLKKIGGKIILSPDIVSYYYPSADFISFLEHNFNDGFWVTYPLNFNVRIFRLRHLIPLIFTSSILLLLILIQFSFVFRFSLVVVFGTYLILNLFFSFLAVLKNGPKYFLIMPGVFFVRHFVYGLGSIWGLIKLFV